MKPRLPCAIYTRKSSEEGLEQDFNSLHAQREACAAYVLSQKQEGWIALPDQYDDGGYSGGNLERPALQRLMSDIGLGRVKVIVVYKVDRLTRSLADFAKLVELFDTQGVSFVSVTQQFNTTSSMGRLTLNVLLSFAQFEREVTGERIRDKIAASKKKGMWMGGIPPMGYVPYERTLVVVGEEAERVRALYSLYLELGCVREVKNELEKRGWVTPVRKVRDGHIQGGRPFSRGHLHRILSNPIYIGQIVHREQRFPGQHPAIIDQAVWDQVQIQLANNRQGHRDRVRDKEPSLLAGQVFDALGGRLIPNHANKGALRYRYYVSQSLIEIDRTKAERVDEEGLRIPAPELECAVQGMLVEYLVDAHRLLVDLTLEARSWQNLVRQAKQWAETLTGGTAQARRSLIRNLVERVIVQRDQLTVEVRRMALSEDQENEGVITLIQPARFRRSGFGIKLIMLGLKTAEPKVDARLVKLVRRGIGWFRRLVQEGLSPTRIAELEGVSPQLVQQRLPLAFLAPDIVQAIETGKQPVTLTSDVLLKSLPLPADWDQQKRQLGFDPVTTLAH